MRRAALTASSILLVVAASCGGGGGGGGGTDAFSSDLDDLCRPIKKDLADLGIPTSLAEIGTTATKASRLLEEGLASMRKLSIPSGNKTFQNDANDLLDTFGAEVDALDDIAAAAAGGDDVTAQDKIFKFDKLANQANDIADDLDASRCKFDELFSSDVTVDTLPPETLPPETLPPETLPPETLPPETVAPAADNKVVEDLVSQLTPAGDYAFTATPADLFQTFRDLLVAVPIMNDQPGSIGAVDVVTGEVTFSRLFVFAPTGVLTPDSVLQFATFVAAGQPTELASFSSVNGFKWVTVDGTHMFVGSIGEVMVWNVATNPVDLEAGVTDLIDSIG